MKWLGQILTSLFLVAAGALVLAAVQEPITQYFSGDRLTARIEVARWNPRPSQPGAVPDEAELASNREIEAATSGEQTQPQFARMVIENPGQKTATAVRIRFEGLFSPDIMMKVEGQRATYHTDVKDLRLKNLAPGEVVVLNMWEDSGFPSALFPDALNTYSSLGAFRLEFQQPETKYWFEDESAVEWFLDEWLGTILIVLLLLLLVVIGLGMALYHAYYTALLKDSAFYNQEKARYDVDPKKFEPKLPS